MISFAMYILSGYALIALLTQSTHEDTPMPVVALMLATWPVVVIMLLAAKGRGLWARAQARWAAFTLLALFCALPLAAQVPVMVNTTRLYPDSTVEATWQRVVSCAGPHYVATQTFEQIKFYERDTLPRPHGEPVLKGQWIAPDTIYLTKGFIHNGWVVAHEMLHHALNGPAGDIKHPIEPFLFPCDLYTEPKPVFDADAPGVTTLVKQRL